MDINSGPASILGGNGGESASISQISEQPALPMPAGSLVTASTDLQEGRLIDFCTQMSSQYHLSDYNVSKRKTAIQPGLRPLRSSPQQSDPTATRFSPRRLPSPTVSPGVQRRSPSQPLGQTGNRMDFSYSQTKSAAQTSHRPFSHSQTQSHFQDENETPAVRKSRSPTRASRSSSPIKDSNGDSYMRSSSVYTNPSTSGRTSPVRAPPGSHHASFTGLRPSPVISAAHSDALDISVPLQNALLDAVQTPLLASPFPKTLRRAQTSAPAPDTPKNDNAAFHNTISLPGSPRLSPTSPSPGLPVPEHLIRTSASHPLNISPILPEHHLGALANQLFSVPKSLEDASPTVWHLMHDGEARLSMAQLLEPAKQSQDGISRFGNLYLSSCPGKKIRLTGPAVEGGRGAIRRDLEADLQRIASFSKAVVCCLDNTELSFLGVEWADYDRLARKVGLEVVRLPIAEGYAPSDIHDLDRLLSTLIEAYSVYGHGILIHCRGGVGRAGLLAVCWALKVGILGDISTIPAEEMVARAISWIRSRRSMKAIETPVQVFFLYSFIQFLQNEGGLISAADLLL